MGNLVERLGLYLDHGARWVAALLMGVITLNVILRPFGMPLTGIVEYVQFLTALTIGLGLAHCGAQGGHIAVTFFTDKLPSKIQGLVFILVDGLVACFLGIAAWQLFKYGQGMQQAGEIALATGMVVYPFVYVIAASFAVYLLVALAGLVKTFQNAFAAKPAADQASKSEDTISIDL